MDELLKKLLSSLSAAKSNEAKKSILLGLGQLVGGSKTSKALTPETQELLQNMIAMINQIQQMEAASGEGDVAGGEGQEPEGEAAPVVAAKGDEGSNASDPPEKRIEDQPSTNEEGVSEVGKQLLAALGLGGTVNKSAAAAPAVDPMQNMVQLQMLQQLSAIAKSVQSLASQQKEQASAIEAIIGGDDAFSKMEKAIGGEPQPIKKSGNQPVLSQDDALAKLLGEIRDGVNKSASIQAAANDSNKNINASSRELLAAKSEGGKSALHYFLDEETFKSLPLLGKEYELN